MREPQSATQLTRLLQGWSSGDASSLEQLSSLVYSELHRIALGRMGAEQAGHLLEPSALVNEAFLRLLQCEPVHWESRLHFFGVCARLMREILIDFARAQETNKRGQGRSHVNLSQVRDAAVRQTDAVGLIDLDAALKELAQLDPRQEQVVKLRYFGGLNNSEIAAVLGVSEPTVVRDWRMARAWLFQRLQSVSSR